MKTLELKISGNAIDNVLQYISQFPKSDIEIVKKTEQV